MATVKPWAQQVCRVLSISFQGSPSYQSLGAREREPGNEQNERESTENEVRVLSAVFGVLEKMTKMAQNVYTFYEEVKKKNQPNYCPRLVADYKRESENMVI